MIKWALTTIVWFDQPPVLRRLHFDTQDSLNLLVVVFSSFLGGDDHSRVIPGHRNAFGVLGPIVRSWSGMTITLTN